MRKAWLFTLLSNKEGLGVVFMEAQACGLPCVGPQVGGVPEVIEEGETGYLIDFSLPDAEVNAAKQIVTILRNNSLRERMSQAAVRRARKRFDEHTAYFRLERIVLEAIRSNKVVNKIKVERK